MKSGILYGMCWEDPDIFTALISENDRVLTVCSAGDIALSTLVKNPASVTAVDTNPDQLNLSKLKAACFQNLDYDACHDRIGTFDHRKKNDQIPQINEDLKLWSDQHGLSHSAMLQQGRFERYMHWFVSYLWPIAVPRSILKGFLAAKNVEEQQEIYHKRINNPRYRFLFKQFFGRLTMSRYGRHPDLLKHVSDNPASVLYDRMEHAWLHVPIEKNYFFRFILERSFRADAPLPIWAQRSSFGPLKSSISKLEFVEASMHEFLKNSKETFHAINLSNITEVMDQTQAQVLFGLCRSRIEPGGRLLIWNTMVDRKPVDGWVLNQELSSAHWDNRCASFYGYLGIYNPA